MPDWHVGHELNAAADDRLVGAGRDETHAGRNGCIAGDASHGDGVSWRLIRKSSRQRSLSCDIRRLHFLDHSSVNDVVDELLVNASLAQKAQQRVPSELVRHHLRVLSSRNQERRSDTIDQHDVL